MPHAPGQIEAFRRAGLPAAEVRCLALTVFDGLRQREAARAIGVSTSTVRRRIRRARRRLREAGLTLRNLVREDRPVQLTLPQGEIAVLGSAITGMW